MKKTRFTEHQVLQVLKELEAGISAIDLSRKLGVSNATIYNWRAKYGGMTESELKRLRKLEDENHHHSLNNLTPHDYAGKRKLSIFKLYWNVFLEIMPWFFAYFKDLLVAT